MLLRTLLTCDADLSAVPLNELFRNEYPDTGTNRRTSREECLKHSREILRCNAHSIIRDRNTDM